MKEEKEAISWEKSDAARDVNSSLDAVEWK